MGMTGGRRAAAWCGLTIAAAGALAQQPPAPAPRPVIRTQDDLPRHLYPVPTSAEALLAADDATFDAFAARVARDADAVLRGYDIPDRATRRRLLGTRASYEMLAGRDKQALATILAVRALEDKPDARLTSGLREEAILRARIATGSRAGPAFEARFASLYRDALAALPIAVVGTRLKESRSKMELQTPALVGGYIASQVGAAVAREHAVTDKAADDLLWARTFLTILMPTRDASLAALRSVIVANTTAKPDIWAAREVTLTPADHGRPVIVAIWDSGVDLALFPGRTHDVRTRAGPPDNGHGISFDVESRPTTGLLKPLTAEQRAAYAGMIDDFQGMNDSKAAINSPAADRMRARRARMTAAENAAYLDRLNFFGDYSHGTHVAGIAVRGNPFVRLAVIRDTYDTRAVPTPPSDARVARRAALYASVSAWLKAHRVRVVNMSWGDTPDSYEHDLEANGLGGSIAARKALARRYYDAARAAFARILADNPATLFVTSAGNTDSDAGFAESYPASLTAPNLLVVSAVDQAGDEAGFTSYGRTVAVSADGYLVRSVVPGGATLAMSGTSQAAPNVANLAAKLIALRPALTPPQIVDLIKAGATASADGRRRNIDPRASVALLGAGHR